jgi:hypothetical protein
MNWRYKAFLQANLSHLPASHELNYLFRRYVTKTVPASASLQALDYSFAAEHLAAFCASGSFPIESALFYEFGVGWDLMIPLSLYSLGVSRQIVTDVRRLLKPNLIAHATENFPSLHLHPTTLRDLQLFPRSVRGRDVGRLLKEYYGIDYRAPFDARTTGFAPNSVDYVTATKVLPFIPVSVMVEILCECVRILRPGGMLSVLNDYRDNWSYVDRSISVYNFLKYPDEIWKKSLYNPALYYQNRLRHCDYRRLFKDAGLEIVKDEPGYGGEMKDARALLSNVTLAERFTKYDLDDLIPIRGVFVLRKKLAKAIGPRSCVNGARTDHSVSKPTQ